MSSKREQLVTLIAPVVEALKCELWGIELVTQSKSAKLCVYIDAAEGVTLEDCERVSRQISSVMDVEDPIRTEYTLEVSSPGLDRPLYTAEQYERFAGEAVALKLRQAFDGRRNFTGQLRGVENGEVVLLVEDHEYCLPVESIEKARIVPTF